MRSRIIQNLLRQLDPFLGEAVEPLVQRRERFRELGDAQIIDRGGRQRQLRLDVLYPFLRLGKLFFHLGKTRLSLFFRFFRLFFLQILALFLFLRRFRLGGLRVADREIVFVIAVEDPHGLVVEI